jgi:hypothetical protein
MRLVQLFEADLPQRWIHYSDTPMLTLNPKGFHQDPLGIYFFPADFVSRYAIWNEKAYKFTVALKPNARVLHYGAITDQELDQLLTLTGAKENLEASIQRYPPKNHKDVLDRAWSSMRDHYMRQVPAAWSKAIMQCGWDAIYDDTGAIHTAEPRQLLVVNPRVIQVLDMQRQKLPVFQAMQKVTHDVAELGKQFGPVTVEPPRRQRERWSYDTYLGATVRIEPSERNYMTLEISYRPEDRQRTRIQVSVKYASPSLGYGSGAEYNIVTQSYDDYGNLDRLRRDMTKVFQSEAMAA